MLPTIHPETEMESEKGTSDNKTPEKKKETKTPAHKNITSEIKQEMAAAA